MSELEIIRHAKVGGISAFFDTVEYRTPHFHPEWELIWITDGVLAVNSGQREALCGKGELCLFPPRQIHEFRGKDGAATFLCLQIAPQVFSAVDPALASLTADSYLVRDYLDGESGERLRVWMKELMAEYLQGSAFYELRCASYCARILNALLLRMPVRRLSDEELRHADRRNERMDRFLRYVDENYPRKLSLEEFAGREGCSVSYMSRFLKANLNQSFQDYVNAVRYHAACRLIAAGGRRMIDVCEECGFSDYRYFSSCFKKKSGLTPEQYSKKSPPEGDAVQQRSLHSLERFYTREESEQLLQTL